MTMPIFVKVEKHRDLQQMLAAINVKLAGVEKTLEKINDLKKEEDMQLQTWRDNLLDVKVRLQRINQDFSG